MLFLIFKNNMDLEQYTLEDEAYPLVDTNKIKIFNQHGFEKFDLYFYKVPADCSCFFHCVLLSHYIPYRKNGIEYEYVINNNDKNKTTEFRKKYCANFRIEVANSLYDRKKNKYGVTVRKYDLLGNGNVKEFAKHMPFYEIKNLHTAICNYKYSVGEEIIEIMKDVIEQNIFILNYEKKDIYNGITSSYYRDDWPSIVLLYYPTPEDDSYVGHYELIGIPKIINNQKIIVTHFQNNHAFIQFLLNREIYINKKVRK